MATQYDAIVVGGGHNGLVTANYLARAGMQILVLERRNFVGGACITEELFPGFRVSSCSYICHILQDQVIEDLELRNYGFEIHSLEPTRFHPFPDGQYLLGWHDDERTAEEIRRLSPRDAGRFPDWIAFWERAAGILHRYFLTEPPTLAEVAASVRDTPDEPVFERMLTGNMKDLVAEYFESDLVRATYIDAQDAGDVSAPGSIMAVAYYKSTMFSDDRNVGIPYGGMGGITQAMARSAQANGVEIRLNAEIERIAIRNGRAAGVILTDGEEIEADVVISNADPKRTFLTLVDPAALDPGFVARIQRLKTNVSYLKFHCALRELPDFSAHLGDGFNPQYLASTRICPSVEYYEQCRDDARRGLPSSCPVMSIQIPSVYDKSLTPPDQHVMSIWVLYAPVRLREGSWDDANERVGEHLIDTVNAYAPNFRNAIIDWTLFTPADLERRVYLTDGNIRHLDITPEQMLAQRSNQRRSSYSTPIEGLYLCGAGTHPGGEVTGAPGHNAAKAILRDWETR
ncbi:NAD(P)/FAD-dependent oxidoreductase [Chloroflexi bacterium TSY]|nr:NAD(P)/FAD-dependent oxidoreductase [Chloroflexi bacterium TSY]